MRPMPIVGVVSRMRIGLFGHLEFSRSQHLASCSVKLVSWYEFVANVV
jgi:hypothetical protein